MGEKILVPCLDVIMIAFSSFSIRNIMFHCIFLGKKGDHYYIQTRQKDLFFPLQSYSKKTLRKKCPEKRSKIQTKCAHALWASYNTP